MKDRRERYPMKDRRERHVIHIVCVYLCLRVPLHTTQILHRVLDLRFTRCGVQLGRDKGGLNFPGGGGLNNTHVPNFVV